MHEALPRRDEIPARAIRRQIVPAPAAYRTEVVAALGFQLELSLVPRVPHEVRVAERPQAVALRVPLHAMRGG